MFTYELSVNIILHMLILITLLSFLFWFYIKNVAKEAITHEINDNINKSFEKLKEKITSEQKQVLKTKMNENKNIIDVLDKIYAKENPVIKTHNDWLSVLIVLSVMFMLVLLISVSYTMSLGCQRKVDFKMILLENITLFLCIGVVEFLFFTRIAVKFVPTKPSLIVNSFLETIKTNLTK